MAAMTAPVNGHEEDAKLVSQCLDFCQTLAGKSLSFSFSLTIGTNFSFSVDTMGKGALAPKEKKKKTTPSAMRRNARRREEFLNKKLNASTAEKPSQSEPAAVKESEGPAKAPSGLHHHPSPSPSSERRQVITVGRERARPTFSQLDGDPPSSPDPTSGSPSLPQDNLVLPHYHGDNMTRMDDSGDQSVFACDNCFHLWRTEEEVDNCECSTHHDCSPYCLFVNVVSKDCDSDL